MECSLKQIAFWDTKQGVMEYQQVSAIPCILSDHSGITLQINVMETVEIGEHTIEQMVGTLWKFSNFLESNENKTYYTKTFGIQ